ncbi:hypothetical protein SHIRM173S_02273 [Streptomyces hirsutus]
MLSSSSPSKAIVTTMPGPTVPSAASASPTLAFSRSWVSCRTRSSCLPCSSLAAWYPPFSRRSPSSRAAAIFAEICRARGTSKVLKLDLELVVRLLGQPGDVLAGWGHSK